MVQSERMAAEVFMRCQRRCTGVLEDSLDCGSRDCGGVELPMEKEHVVVLAVGWLALHSQGLIRNLAVEVVGGV